MSGFSLYAKAAMLQLLTDEQRGPVLADSDRSDFSPTQLMNLSSIGQPLSPADRAKFSGSQLLNFASLGNRLTAAEIQKAYSDAIGHVPVDGTSDQLSCD